MAPLWTTCKAIPFFLMTVSGTICLCWSLVAFCYLPKFSKKNQTEKMQPPSEKQQKIITEKSNKIGMV
jgi:hypothetical protein